MCIFALDNYIFYLPYKEKRDCVSKFQLFYSQTSEWSGTTCWSRFRASAENERLKYPAGTCCKAANWKTAGRKIYLCILWRKTSGPCCVKLIWIKGGPPNAYEIFYDTFKSCLNGNRTSGKLKTPSQLLLRIGMLVKSLIQRKV